MIRSKALNPANILVSLLPGPPQYHFIGEWKSTALKEQQFYHREVLRKVFRAYFSSCWPPFQRSKASALCGRLDVAMIFFQLWMYDWPLQKDSLALNETAPLPCAQSTEIVIWRGEFIVVSIARLSAILPKDESRDSGRWDGETGRKTISGGLSGWNLRRHPLEYDMHLSNNYYHTLYSSSLLSQYASAFDGLGHIHPRTPFLDRQLWSAPGNDASISWLRTIPQAIEPGEAMEW